MGAMLDTSIAYAQLMQQSPGDRGNPVQDSPGMYWVAINSDIVRRLMFEVRRLGNGVWPCDLLLM
jgi:hypothetical protein